MLGSNYKGELVVIALTSIPAACQEAVNKGSADVTERSNTKQDYR